MASFSMLMLGMLKHSLFLEKGLDYTKDADVRNALRIKMNILNTDEACLHFSPYLFAVHTLVEEGTACYDEQGTFAFPQLLALSMTSLTNTGIYLLDEGNSLYMYVGSQVDRQIMQNMFGINSIKDAGALTEDNLYQN
jgi:protein transport protein SEC24